MNNSTANVRCQQLVQRYPQVHGRRLRYDGQLIMFSPLQIWEYVRTTDHPVFYYTSQRSDPRAPTGSVIVTDLELLSWLSGPALLFRKDIVVCTHTFHDIPNGDFLHVVRL